MKKEHLLVGGGVAIILLIIWIAFELDGKKKMKKENQDLKKDKLNLMMEYLKIADDVPSEIKSQIKKLITEYENLDPKVAKELLNVLNLIEQGMQPKAITTLAKIIENLLKDKYAETMLLGRYSSNEEFSTKKKKITFHKVIEYAKEDDFLSEEEYQLTTILRGFRNEESHELDANFGKNLETIAFLTGIEIVAKIVGTNVA